MNPAQDSEMPPKRVLLLVEWTPTGTRVSHCRPSEPLAALAQEELRDRSPANLLQITERTLTDWLHEYAFGAWSRGVHR